MTEQKKLTRLTGWLYLVVIVCAGFSQGAVRESVLVTGDALTTAQNILASETLFRWGLITDLIAFSTDIAISVLLYLLLSSVNKPLALIMAAFRLIAHPAIASMNLLNHYAALKVLQDPELASQFSPERLYEASLFFMEAHHMGYLIAGVVFGIHCAILGYLLVRSGAFPKLLGALLMLASVGYLTESFGFMLYPEYKAIFAWIVGISAGIGEVGLCLWFIVSSYRRQEWRVES
ncbi:DUF4386 domain-containing protein [Balneola sp. MJW-20]|uniref:DUF4386 domain-containing protein n=1 Tax=Gracilimonas aurantiaca TaxID=3234185 RepID=UPI003467DA9D